MQILKAFFKITKKLLPTLISYVVIFSAIIVLITVISEKPQENFEQTKLDVVVFDEDNSPESEALYNYIASNNNILDFDKNDTEKLQDNLYYQKIDCVFTIKEGYGEKIKAGETDNLFAEATDPMGFSAQYFDIQIGQYIRSINAFLASGMSFDEASEKTEKLCSQNIEVITTKSEEKSTGALNVNAYTFLLFIPYVLPSMFVCLLSRIIITLNKKDVKNRTSCSPVSATKKTSQILAGTLIFSMVLFLILMIILTIYSKGTIFCQMGFYAIINSLLFLLISAGLAVLVSMFFSDNSSAIDMISNVISLGTCFVCGVFVPQYLLSDKVLAIGRFFPPYWYVKAINMIGGANGIPFEINQMWLCFGVEFIFAIALFAAALVVSKFRRFQ